MDRGTQTGHAAGQKEYTSVAVFTRIAESEVKYPTPTLAFQNFATPTPDSLT